MALPRGTSDRVLLVEGRMTSTSSRTCALDNSGQLEDLVAAMIPAEDVVWSLAQEFVNRIPAPERPMPAIKAQVHAWLAARAAARPMGSAIGTGHLDASSPPATRFVSWLQLLFHAPATGGT